ncbi:MAG: FAD-dependent monooxygenase, partial [Actinomycetota bacterium]|nr:FAD-dependent monooxygenase [Actinomycetota bacterium]
MQSNDGRAVTSADVVVVGAGPVGLLLAGDLVERGVAVTVVEQLTEPTTESRASTVHTRTMDLFAERGLLADLAPTRGGAGHFGGIPLDLTAAAPDHRHAGQWKVPQTRIEAVLQDRALAHGARVLRGHRVTGLAVRPDHVEVETTTRAGQVRIRCAYLVGCDGERSTVRRLAGFDFPGRAARRELLRADVAGIDIRPRRFERLPNGLAIAAPGQDGITRVMMHEFGTAPLERTAPPDFAEVVAVWRRITGEDISGGEPVWVNAFTDACRQVTRYRQGRVLLAGDAAHVQLPAGGQAINLGLQDAADLGWKLAAQFGG